MQEEPRIRRRARLREREAAQLRADLAAMLGGAALWAERATLESAEFLDLRVLVVDNMVHGVWDGHADAPREGPESGPFLTVRGLLAHKPEARAVTVDMGAVKFVCNGADVMAPGIVAADPAIQPGHWVWIRDERNRQPLAIGRALVPGTAMPKGKGKAVRSVHHLGDKLWNVSA